MPLINYLCECNHSVSKFFRQVKDSPAFFSCTKCGKDAKKILMAPNSTSVLTVDNGVQARAVEVNLEIVESIKDRANKDAGEK